MSARDTANPLYRPLVATVLALLIPACSAGPDRDQENGEAGLVRAVVTRPAAEAMLHTTIEMAGEVRPWAAVTVAAEAAGRVVELQVEVGDKVSAGEILVRLDDEQVQARHKAALAEVARAEAALEQAERDRERGRQLAATRDIAEGDLERLVLACDTLAAQLDAARAGLDLAEQAVADTVVRAPFAGIISERMVEQGSWIAPGAPVARLLDQDRLKVAGAASQRDRARLEAALPAEITAPALPGEVYAGTVRLLGQEAEPATGTYLVEIAVNQPVASSGARLLPGMQARVTIALGSTRTLAVPRQALVSTSAGEGVFIVNAGKAHFRTPELGQIHDELVEIRSGLAPGDQVVISGQHVLSNGCPVQVVSGS
jgi:RND family efflux transporter MFP subunit